MAETKKNTKPENATRPKDVSQPQTEEDKNIKSIEGVEAVETGESKTLKKIYDEALSSVIEVQEETHPELKPILQRIANDTESVLLSFIAPTYGKRISPSEARWASIRSWEEIGIDKAIIDIKQRIKKTTKPNLMFLVNSPGGRVDSSFVIATMIRDAFENIKVFIPSVAASGGTLLAIIGNEIVMGPMSRLSPIDTQVPYKNGRVSAQSMRRALRTYDKYFAKKHESEVPYPRKMMCEKFDPILFEEWEAELNEIYYYAIKLLKKAKYNDEKAEDAAWGLVFSPYSHEFVINKDRVKEILELNVVDSGEYEHIWKVFKTWYALYVTQSEDKHFIRYVLPEDFKIEVKNAGK